MPEIKTEIIDTNVKFEKQDEETIVAQIVKDFTTWDDKEIALKGKDLSLLEFMRTSVTEFLEIPKIADFILGMVILLCVVIFSELALA